MSTKPRLHTIAQFCVNHLCYLDQHHRATQALPEFADAATLKQLYRLMLLVRTLDNKVINLQRMGKMGTYPASTGQEAVSIGVGHALHADDIYCAAYRDQGVLLQRNISLGEILAYWGGDERGNCYANNAEDLPLCITIAGQCLHAAGIAYAIKYRKQQRAVVTMIGDGGTSKGDFYEAINLAGVWQLPLVVVINNNQWAISMPLNAQTAAQTLAQKAIAAGVENLQVDGNDVIAVRYAVEQAINKARAGHGPSVIEAVTYRLCDHTTVDDASRYRATEAVKQAWQQEPITRLGQYLIEQGLWSESQDQQLRDECTAEIEAALQSYFTRTKPNPTDMFDYLYAQLPDSLVDQRDALLAEVAEIKK